MSGQQAAKSSNKDSHLNFGCGEGQQNNEGPGISQEDLRQVQGDYPQGCCTGHLRKRKAQAAPGISKSWQARILPRKNREKETGKTGSICTTSKSLLTNLCRKEAS